MAKTFKITEEQYRMAMNEGVELSVKPKAGESDPQAFQRTAAEAQNNGLNMKGKVTLTKDATDNGTLTQTTESRVVKKDKLGESRLNELKRNSKLYSVSDFMNIVTKK